MVKRQASTRYGGSKRRAIHDDEEDNYQPVTRYRRHHSPGVRVKPEDGTTSGAIETPADPESEAEQDDSNQAHHDHDHGNDDEGELTMAAPLKLPVSDSARKAADDLGEEIIKRKANDLVRLALASESQKVAIKREDIVKKVLGLTSRAFPVVFNRAQKTLSSVFGYSLVQLRRKGTENVQILEQATAAAAEAETLDESRRGADKENENERGRDTAKDGEAKKAAGSNIWVLKSILPTRLIQRYSKPVEDLANSLQQPEEAHITATGADSSGIVLDWAKSGMQQGAMGLLYVVLALILLNGRSMKDDQLRAYLKRLHLYPEKPLPSALQMDAVRGSSDASTQSATQTATQARSRRLEGTSLTMDGFLHLMRKQAYLESVSTDGAARTQAGTQARGGRPRARAGGEDDYVPVEWRWGSRAEAEVSEASIAEMIAMIFTDPAASAGVEEIDITATNRASANGDSSQRPGSQRTRASQQKKMLIDSITRAAGSALVP